MRHSKSVSAHSQCLTPNPYNVMHYLHKYQTIATQFMKKFPKSKYTHKCISQIKDLPSVCSAVMNLSDALFTQLCLPSNNRSSVLKSQYCLCIENLKGMQNKIKSFELDNTKDLSIKLTQVISFMEIQSHIYLDTDIDQLYELIGSINAQPDNTKLFDNFKKEAIILKDAINEFKSGHQQCTTENELLKEEIMDLKKESKNLLRKIKSFAFEDKCTQSEDDPNEKLANDRISKLVIQIKGKDGQIDMLSNKINSILLQFKNDLETYHNNESYLENQIASLSHENETTKIENEKLKGINDMLASELTKTQDNQVAVEEMNQQISKLNSDKAQLRSQMADIFIVLESEVQLILTELNKCNDINIIKQTIQHCLCAIQKISEEISQESNRMLNESIAVILNEQLNEIKMLGDEKDKHIQSLNSSLSMQKEMVHDLEMSLEKQKSICQMQIKEYNQLEQKYSTILKDIREMTVLYDHTKLESQNIIENYKMLQSSNSKKESIIKQLLMKTDNMEKVTLQSQRYNIIEERNKYQQTIDSQQKTMQDYASQIAQLQEQIKSMETLINSLPRKRI